MKIFNFYILFGLFCISFFSSTIALQAQNNALNFDGVDDYVELSSDFGNGVDNTASLNDFASFDFTIEFWIKAPTPTSNQVILSKWNESNIGNSSFIAQLLPITGELEFKVKLTNEDIQQIQSSSAIADNSWHHVAIVHGRDNQIQMYIDGIKEQDSLLMMETYINPTNNPFLLGKEVSSSASFAGTLDELRIWQVERTECEILSTINSEINASFANDLLAYHTFNQGIAAATNTVTQLDDNTLMERNATLYNFALTGISSNWVSGRLITGTQNNPELGLTGNDIEITNGDITPSKEDLTDFGAANDSTSKFYNIKNSGTDNLSVTTITSSNPRFSVPFSSYTINPCSSEFIEVEFTPNGANLEESIITITSNDGGITNNTYTFKVQARGAPQINLTGTTDFGNGNRCDIITQQFTIRNTGFDNLILYGKVKVSGNTGFKITSPPSYLPILPNEFTTFEIQYNPTKVGTQNATIFINSNAGISSLNIIANGNPATYPDYKWETLGNVGFSAENTQFHSLKIANNGTPYVAFQEGTSQKTSVMKYNGSTWQYVGQEISIGVSSYQSLAIDNNENLYVAYQDGANNNATTVLKYNGTNWITLGSALSGINNSYQNIALDKEENIFVAFRNTTGKAKVMTYTGVTNSWQNVGTDAAGFSIGEANYVSLAISSSGRLRVAYRDESQPNRGTTIMSLSESDNNWSDDVFNDGDDYNLDIPPTNSTQQNLALDIYGSPYIALLDGSSAEVIRDVEGWFTYGSSPSTTTAIGNIVIDVDGTVYLCFKDDANGNKATVRKNNGFDWEDVGTVGFSEGAIEDINLAIDNNGILYVAYKDLAHSGKTTVMRFVQSDKKPEINVRGNGNNITFGSTIPIIQNNTDFGFLAFGANKTVTYTIQNTGDLDLDINSITISGDSEFSLIGFLPTTVSANSSANFNVFYSGSSVYKEATATITINNSDCDEGNYTFRIKAISDVLTPKIRIYENNAFIDDGQTSSFGTIPICKTGRTKTYTIRNEGNIDLIVSLCSFLGSSDFVLTGLSATSLVLPRLTTKSFSITFTPSSVSPQTASLCITNNDIDPIRNPYDLTIDGTGFIDNQPPRLINMPDFVRNADTTNCFFTNINTSENPSIPSGQAINNCRIESHTYVLTGATTTTVSSLYNVKFEKGITKVVWSVINENGTSSSTDEFLVTIQDKRKPTLIAPTDITLEADLYGCILKASNFDLGEAIVSDNCLFRIENDKLDEYPIGKTTVTWRATDSSGNVSTAKQIITVKPNRVISPTDSLTLVNIYNQTGGQNWNNPWNLNTPVYTWNGVDIDCGKVVSINLSSNNLTGRLPNSVLNLSQINNSNFTLRIGGNRLGFESAENFVGKIPNFVYSPQADIYSSTTEIVPQGNSVSFSSETEGNFNSYQWYKNNVAINGATLSTFSIQNALPSDIGTYTCKIKNKVATQLTLERRPIRLIVEGFLNPTDSMALVTIYQKTGGDDFWTIKWDLSKPVSTWEGITLSGNKVTEIDLSSRNMTGILPNVFDAELFSELSYLSFFNNNLEGQIPATIGTISTLTYLDLDKNKFEGDVPTSFGNLINLQALWLSRNNLTSLPTEIGNLINLKNLYLNGNKFSNLPETIGNLSGLLVVNASDNQLSELPNSITNLQKLIELYANRNLISVLPIGMQNLISLVIFEMNINNLSSIPTGLSQISNLKILRVAENKLEFDDLLPFTNSNFTIFEYAPQAPINEEIDSLVTTGSPVSFTIITQGKGNVYEWLKDGNPVSILQNFTINRVRNTDAGIYTANITNPSLPNLILQRRFVRLGVECQSGLNFEIKKPQQTIFCEGQPFGLKLEVDEQFGSVSQIRWRKDGIILAFANEKSFTVTQTGIYTAEMLTSNGCTALSNKVEITSIPKIEVAILLENKEILTSKITSQEAVTYQWLKDGNPIENGFENSYIPTKTGEYSLLVLSQSGCSSVSETIIFTTDEVTGIEEPKELRNLALYPNPNNGNFFVDFGTKSPNAEPTFMLIDAIGRQLNLKTHKITSTRYDVKTNNLAGGIYYLQIQTKDGIAFRKFVIEE